MVSQSTQLVEEVHLLWKSFINLMVLAACAVLRVQCMFIAQIRVIYRTAEAPHCYTFQAIEITVISRTYHYLPLICYIESKNRTKPQWHN